MTKFAKVIDVEGIKGIDQILIYVHQNNDDLYVVSIFTHLPICEARLTLNINPKHEDDNCHEGAIALFNQLSKRSDKYIIAAITEQPIYQSLLELNDDF